MKQIKQLATSKRMGMTITMNTGWLIITLIQLKELRDAAESLASGYAWANYFGVGVVVLSILGMAWTKGYDDQKNQSETQDDDIFEN